MKVTDEMLMAFADGELDRPTAEAVQRAAEADPALMRRLADFERTRTLAKAAFGGVLEEEIPQRLLSVVRPRPARVFGFLRWEGGWLPPAAVVAASLAGFALAAILTPAPAPEAPPLLASHDTIAEILETTPSGETRLVAGSDAGPGGAFEATASYLVPGGACRSFEMSLGADAETGWRGVACRREGTWRIDMLAADPGATSGGETYATASDAAVQSLDAFLDAAGAGGSLDDAEERRLVESGWADESGETRPQ